MLTAVRQRQDAHAARPSHLEATRIRLVSEPGFAKGLIGGFSKIAKTEGIGAFYSGFGPILFKQYVL